MCGICGAFSLEGTTGVDREVLLGMVRQLFHRGPDEQGILRGPGLGLGHARLSIIDLAGGRQPMGNEDGSVWVVFNGEIYNYLELMPLLEEKGHTFRTRSDTEVLLHLWEEEGPAMVERLNGQFAFALWDRRRGSLFLARDPVGIRPLYFAFHEGWFLFGSEVKSILAWPGFPRELDRKALKEIFTFWAPSPGRSAFRGVRALPPGHRALLEDGELRVERWFEPSFEGGAEARRRPAEELAEELREHLLRASRLRLRSDVPVGAYLSGGLDSSVIAATVARFFRETKLSTFSIRFSETYFDEGSFQKELAGRLGTDHHEVVCRNADIGRVFPLVVEHTECPVLRTAPAPMFLLSRLVRESGYKVVLTGEGADEMLGGYDIFRETKVRAFWARNPASEARPRLLTRLYPWMTERSPARRLGFAKAFFGRGLDRPEDPWFSHLPRWESGARLMRLFSGDVLGELEGHDPRKELEPFLPAGFGRWSWLARAQALEVMTILSGYILSSQGDRMLMGNSVEGRFPFLDPELMAFAGSLPRGAKIRGLVEKFLLKKAMGDLLPPSILERPKQPYRAPDAQCFFGGGRPSWVEDVLSPPSLERAGLFDPGAVKILVEQAGARKGAGMSHTDNAAVVGVLSTMLLHRRLVEEPRDVTPRAGENLVVDLVLGGENPGGPGRWGRKGDSR